MDKIGMTIEIELGITGGEEDGVDNTNVEASKLYTQPKMCYVYEHHGNKPKFYDCSIIWKCTWSL